MDSHDCGRYHFAKDMNGDGVFTITDLGQILEFIWLLPAKVGVSALESQPQLASFFEISCNTGTSWGAVIFSFIVWIIVLAAVS
jgi:hypothetical protein